MGQQRWYERYAWVYFAVVAAVGLAGAVVVLVDPSSGDAMFERFGFEAPAAIIGDAEAQRYVEHLFEWSAGMTVGVDLFTLLIAATAFRRGERWAWLAFWYWPAAFLSHFLLYESDFRYAQLVWMALAVAALAVTARRAWSPGPAPEGSIAPAAAAR